MYIHVIYVYTIHTVYHRVSLLCVAVCAAPVRPCSLSSTEKSVQNGPPMSTYVHTLVYGYIRDIHIRQYTDKPMNPACIY